MKKLLTLAATGLVCVAGYAQSQTLIAEDRSSWAISGCSEANQGTDGGFDEIKDGNTSTFWHSAYGSLGSYSTACPHYFVIDRGESAANAPIDAFAYQPRQGNSNNGDATSYKLYVLPDIEGLETVYNTSATVHINNAHTSLTTFLNSNGEYLAAQGNFDYSTNAKGLKQVILDKTHKGRYVLFVVTGATRSDTRDHFANCAEFYLYKVNPEVATRVSLSFKRSSDDANPYVITPIALYSANFPEYEGFTCGNNSAISSSNITATYIMNAGVGDFYLYNERKGTYVRGNSDNNNDLRQEKTDNPGSEALFRMIPMGSDGGFAIYYPAAGKFVGNIVGTQSTTPLVDLTATPQKYYTGKQDAPDNYMSWIGNTTAKGDNDYCYFNDLGTWGVCGYTWNDAGSKWVIVTNLEQFKENLVLRQTLRDAIPNYEAMLAVLGETDTEGLKEWAQNYDFGGDINAPVTDENQAKIDKIMNITLRADIKWAKLKGNKLATLDFITAAGKTAWETAYERLKDAPDTEETLTELTVALTALGKATAETHLKFQSGKPNCEVDYLGANIGNAGANPLAPTPRRWSGGAECRIWTLRSADGGGFYLFNEYTNKYMKHPAAGGYATFVSDASAASVYLIDVSDHENEMYGLRTFDEGVPADGAYLLSDGVNEVERGAAKNVSSWYIYDVTPEDAANEHLAGAKFYYNSHLLGEGLGKYTANSEAVEAAKVTTDASIDEKRDAATKLFAAQFTLNMPKAGTYLTIDGASVENTALFYTTATYEHNGHNKTIVDKAHADYNTANAILYYDGSHLLSYSTGYYLGISTPLNTEGWPTFISAADMNAGGRGNTPVTIGIAPGSHAGLYQLNYLRPGENNCGLHINTLTDENNVTHLFGDRCGLGNNNNTTGQLATTVHTHDAHNWRIAQVNELPVAIHADGYGSFIAPVAVSFNANPVYIGSVSGNVLTFTEQSTGEVIAPNTPVIVKGTPSTTINATIHYDYVASDAPATLAVDESTSPLGGSHIAANHVADADHSTFAKTGASAAAPDESTVKLDKVADGSVIPVNTLLLTLPNDSELIDDGAATATININSSNNVTGISAIEFRNLDGTREIYDLQGRRVSKAANGVYIINGKKVLVK